MCVNKRLLENRKYMVNKKNGGNVPVPRDERMRWNWIPCGECYECRKKKAREWRMRIAEEIKENKNAKVVLLTFSTEALIKLKKDCKGYTGYNLDNAICKRAVKLWRENWRKKYKRSPRYWLITELGDGKTEHVHMHGIIWKDPRYNLRNELMDEIVKSWPYGWVGRGKWDYKTGKIINYVNDKTANYFVKYVTKIDEKHKEYKQIILNSMGIGKAFLESEEAKDNRYRGKETIQTYQVRDGGVLPMPEYFRRKMYTEEEREKLQIEYMNGEVIYIGGKEYNKNIGDKKINLMQKALQAKNARMGYGDGRKNYERIIMENERRREVLNKRLSKR